MQTVAKIQVTAIFLTQDMRRNFLSKFIEICMETPHQHGGRKPTETSVTEFCYKRVKVKNINIKLFSYTRTVQIAKFPEINLFLTNIIALSAVM